MKNILEWLRDTAAMALSVSCAFGLSLICLTVVLAVEVVLVAGGVFGKLRRWALSG